MKRIQRDPKEKVENKIIDWITIGSSGNLILSKPDISNSVVDLVVEGRGEYVNDYDVFLQVRSCGKKGKSISTEVLGGEINPRDDFYYLFVSFDIVNQDIFEYVWLIPTTEFFEITEGKDNVFPFQASIDAEDKYKKYLIKRDNLGKILTDIIEKKGSFLFPEEGFSGFDAINLADLKKFIIDARRNTFAGDGASVDNPRFNGSKELEYQKGDWKYQDVYFAGKNNLIGQEVVYHNNNPVWAMAYFADYMPRETTDFLKYALSTLADKCRFGENCELEKRGYGYKDSGTGSLEKFSGQEIVKGKQEYKLNYYGGLI